MPKNHEIDLDEVANILAKRARINRIDIMKAVFVQNGKEIHVTQKERADFRLTGLATIDFAANLL